MEGKRDNTLHPEINTQKANNKAKSRDALFNSGSQIKGNLELFRDKSSVIPTLQR